MTTSDIKSALAAHLALLGWGVLPGTAIANKFYDTAVGPKEAHAYLESWPGECWTLTGTYYSEGNNVLSTTRFRMPLDIQQEALEAIAKGFSDEATKVIGGTYAARLLQPST